MTTNQNQPIVNGIGDIREQVHGTIDEHRERFADWIAFVVNHDLREADTLTSGVLDFAAAASISLEENCKYTGCVACMSASCVRPDHSLGDPSTSFRPFYWTAGAYSCIDHLNGKAK